MFNNIIGPIKFIFDDVLCWIDLEIDCGALSTPVNGEQTSTGTWQDKTSTFSCDYGYDLQGSVTRTCSSSGSWSGTGAVCARKFLFLRYG